MNTPTPVFVLLLLLYDAYNLAKKGLEGKDIDLEDAHTKNISGFLPPPIHFADKKGRSYALGGYNYQQEEGFDLRRLPNNPTANVYSIFPNGYQRISISHIHHTSSYVSALLKGQEQVFFSPADSTRITERGLWTEATLGSICNYKKTRTTLNDINFSEVVINSFPFVVILKNKGKIVIGLSSNYSFISVTFAIDVSDLFDVFPDKTVYENSYLGPFKYVSIQMGMGGSFYFIRPTFKIKTTRPVFLEKFKNIYRHD